MTRVLITRAEPDASEFAAACRSRGLEPVLSPVMRIEIEKIEPDLSDVGALAFTSANGVRAFVPKMLEVGKPCHIINTTSFNGACISFPTTPIYASSKAAVTSLTEVLYAQLAKVAPDIKVHLLFPGPHMVNTQILASQRNRQDKFKDDNKVEDYLTMEDLKKSALGANAEFKLTEPEEVAESCYEGVMASQFWIRPYLEEHQAMISGRTESVLKNENPAVM